ncbi:MAG: hypothetical protein HY023_08140 [Chloroflexi bacterium]|nr:hypothetical protein [Chloroflexota bacterium]
MTCRPSLLRPGASIAGGHGSGVGEGGTVGDGISVGGAGVSDAWDVGVAVGAPAGRDVGDDVGCEIEREAAVTVA